MNAYTFAPIYAAVLFSVTGTSLMAAENLIPCAANFSRFGVSTIELFDHGIAGCIGTDRPFQA
jgi:hypothetical protein